MEESVTITLENYHKLLDYKEKYLNSEIKKVEDKFNAAQAQLVLIKSDNQYLKNEIRIRLSETIKDEIIHFYNELIKKVNLFGYVSVKNIKQTKSDYLSSNRSNELTITSLLDYFK